MAEPDFYAVLGISRDADADRLRSAYRSLARRYHPDVNPGDAAAEDRFKEVSRAYEVLSDDKKRARYDEFGVAGLDPGFDPRAARQWGSRGGGHPFGDAGHVGDAGHFGGGGIHIEDLFGGFGRGGGFGQGPIRGRDQSSRVEVDFIDAVLSREIRITLASGDSLRVNLPAGAHNGTRVRLAGKGEPGARGGPPGDLLLVLRVHSHPRFRRRGDDLEVEVALTVPEWIRGATIEVPTPEGSAQLRVPPRAAIDKRLRLRGKGATRREGGRGHLLVSLVPRLPAEADASELEAIASQLEGLDSDATDTPNSTGTEDPTDDAA